MSKLTVSIPGDLHQKIREELEKQGITTSQFIEQAVTNFFEKPKGDINMATRTLAFQVSEELFQRVKAFLARYEEIYHRKLSQKEFVIGLIEAELDEADEEFAAAEAAAATENPEVEQAAEEPETDETADEDVLATDEDSLDESEAERAEAEFRLADIERKRMIVSQLYSRIEVKRGYEIKLVLDVNYRQLLDGKIDYGVGHLIEKTDIKSLKKRRLSA